MIKIITCNNVNQMDNEINTGNDNYDENNSKKTIINIITTIK